jgi:Ala-tRNA(Pro) deacylase
MPITEELREFLADHNAEYTHHVHRRAYTAQDLAQAEHITPHCVAKTVVFHSDKGYGMAVLPADSYVDLRELRFVLGLDSVRLATEDELLQLFPDNELGAMAPFGNLYGMPVYVDINLAEEDIIAFNAGTHRDVIYMRFADFRRLARPTITFFSERSGHA